MGVPPLGLAALKQEISNLYLRLCMGLGKMIAPLHAFFLQVNLWKFVVDHLLSDKRNNIKLATVLTTTTVYLTVHFSRRMNTYEQFP